MSNLNSTISANRTHIGFFGLRNAGKSSVVNAITNQSMSLGNYDRSSKEINGNLADWTCCDCGYAGYG